MSRKSGTRCNRHVISLRDRAPRHATRSVAVIPAEGAGLRPASEGRNPVTKAVRAFTLIMGPPGAHGICCTSWAHAHRHAR